MGASENDTVDHTLGEVSYTDFVNKELVHFSRAATIRAIPSVVDGFKPSHRKIIFGAFKRKLKNDVKVAQLVGYVSEHAAYHHGEAALGETIVGMAQDYVGSIARRQGLGLHTLHLHALGPRDPLHLQGRRRRGP